MDALKHLDGVTSAKGGKVKTEFLVEVSEKRMILPSKLEKAIPEKFVLNGTVIEAAGTLEKEGDGLRFTARGSGRKFAVKAKEDVAKLAASGPAKVVLRGEVSEPEAEEGRAAPLPEIDAVGATEIREARK